MPMVDMVLEELTRSETPTSARIAEWIHSREIPVVPSDPGGPSVFQTALPTGLSKPPPSGGGYRAVEGIGHQGTAQIQTPMAPIDGQPPEDDHTTSVRETPCRS